MRPFLVISLVAHAAFAPAVAGDWKFSGSVGAEARLFVDDPMFSGQLRGVQASLLLEPELDFRSAAGRHRISIAPFLRVDSRDDERTHFDLREAHWLFLWSDWELLAGVNEVYWGVTESRHLVDVINQKDAVEDVDGEDKLGQPMIQLAAQRSWGRIEGFLLTGFRERTFPGRAGRLRTPLPVDTDVALYESSAEDRRIDLALRYSHYLVQQSAVYALGQLGATEAETKITPLLKNKRLYVRLQTVMVLDQFAELKKLRRKKK